MAKTERKLDFLPAQGSDDIEYRDWLTPAVGCPPGLRFEEFVRHGSQLTDACTFTISVPGGDVMSFRTTQQKLANPATLRATIAYATSGLLRPPQLTRLEYEDVWIAMITLSNIVDSQTEADETWSWLTRYERECDRIVNLSFVGARRYDALMALTTRPRWGRNEAVNPEERPPGARPAWVVDEVNEDEYVRVSELLAFLRYDVGVGPISSSVLTARLHEIGGHRTFYEVRRGKSHPRMTLFLLPAEPAGQIPAAEQ